MCGSASVIRAEAEIGQDAPQCLVYYGRRIKCYNLLLPQQSYSSYAFPSSLRIP